MAEEGALHGFKAGEPQALSYVADARQYWRRAHTDRFFPEDRLASIFLDADSGERKSSVGAYSGGGNMTITSWLIELHMVNDPVDYLGYRVLVVGIGLAVAMLSITVVYVCWKKRKAHAASRARSRAQASLPARAVG